MPVEVVLPAPLVDLFPGARRRLSLEAATVAEMIDALDRCWPGMRDRIADSRPSIRRHINIFVEGERAQLHDPLPDGARVFVLTAISGG